MSKQEWTENDLEILRDAGKTLDQEEIGPHVESDELQDYCLENLTEEDRQRIALHLGQCVECASVLLEQVAWLKHTRYMDKKTFLVRKLERLVAQEEVEEQMAAADPTEINFGQSEVLVEKNLRIYSTIKPNGNLEVIVEKNSKPIEKARVVLEMESKSGKLIAGEGMTDEEGFLDLGPVHELAAAEPGECYRFHITFDHKWNS